MGVVQEAFDWISAKGRGFIGIADYMRYVPTRSFLQINAQDDDTIPNKTWVKGYVNPNGQLEVSINATPFTYGTGITTYKPKYEVCIKTGTVYTVWAPDMNFDISTGIITVNLDYTADNYVLIIG